MQWLLTLRGALPQLTLSNQRSFLQALPMELLAWQSIGSITATFSEAMQSSTINTNTFTVSGGSGNISGAVSSGTTATFTPSGNLSDSTIYTARITTGVRDLAGNAMASDYTWSLRQRVILPHQELFPQFLSMELLAWQLTVALPPHSARRCSLLPLIQIHLP